MTDLAPNKAYRPITLADLASSHPDWNLNGDPKTPIAGITYNSRDVAKGDLFVALRGGYFDGHAFVASAVESGAAALAVERAAGSGIPELVVGDTRAALASLAAEFYGHPSKRITVAGITGTDGKTTTSYLLDAILRRAGMRTGLIGTISIQIDNETVEAETRQTTPESLDVQRHLSAMLERGVDVAIIEATSHGLDLHRLDDVAFQVAGVTNITHEHLEYHKTIAAYRLAKAKLFERVGESRGTVVINLDDEGARQMASHSGPAHVLSYSLERAADVRATDLRLSVTGSRFELEFKDQRRSIELPMLGAYNVSNALCATGLALALGVSLDSICQSLNNAPAIPGRMQRIDASQPFSVIVDYAHTPESLSKVLTLLRTLNPNGRLIVVSGSAGERDVAKRPLQGAACVKMADLSIFTTEDPRFEDADCIIAEIAAGALGEGAVNGRDFVQITDRMTAVRAAIRTAQTDDVVLLAGKGHEQSIIWGRDKHPWDEAAAALLALRELGFEGQA